MLEELLDKAINANEAERTNIIRKLASDPEDNLAIMVQTIKHGHKRWHAVAARVIHTIGFPRNIGAIPALVELVADPNDPGWNDGLNALIAMEPGLVVPHLLRVLWDRGRTNPYWVDEMQGVCTVLVLKREFALQCGPTIAYLLTQNFDIGLYGDPDYRFEVPAVVLKVLEFIGNEGAYALPALIEFANREEETLALREKARQLIATFSQEQLEPYSQVLLPPKESRKG